jgi:2'-5' RNA ligase
VLPGDRLVCGFVEPQKNGLTFEKWLLHITIVPWFRLDDDSQGIAGGMEQALHGIEPFEATIQDIRKSFGARKRAAGVIAQPTPLTDIERKVRTYFHKKRAWLVDETTRRHYDFRPHVTLQAWATLKAGDSFRCDRLYIVEQKGDYKEIVSEIHLGNR